MALPGLSHAQRTLARQPPPTLGRQRLAALLAATEQVTPLLKGELGCPREPGWIGPGQDNAATLRELYGQIRAAHPEAGAAYWSASTWNHLNWQPVAVALLSVHGFGLVPDIGSMAQRHGPDGIAGFRLSAREPQQGGRQHLIATAGAMLRGLAEAIIEELVRLQRQAGRDFLAVKPVMARRLLADRLLGLMIRLDRMKPGLFTGCLKANADLWLRATDLDGASGLQAIRLQNGREQFVLDRRACCMNYLRADGEVCESCPTQQSRETSLRRLTEFWNQHG